MRRDRFPRLLAALFCAVLSMLFFAALTAPNLTAQDKITRAGWGESVGFKPDLASIPDFKAGMTIDASNMATYADFLAEPVKMLMQDYKLTVVTKDYIPYAPSDGYIAATNQYRGKSSLVDIGPATDKEGLAGYVAGLPFPAPENARQVAWNFYNAYSGDDGQHEFGVYWIDAKRGVEREERWRWTVMQAINRTDIAPKPTVSSLNGKKIEAASITETLYPLDRKGQMALYFIYQGPGHREGWLYVPSQKRTFRFSSDNHGEPWNNTDLYYEDIRGYSGRPEWMEWTIVKKTTMFAPVDAEVEYGPEAAEKTYDMKTWPHWNPNLKWQPRPVYVMQLTPKLKGYPYSKQLLYIDAESFYPFAKLAYDRKGNPWKVVIAATNQSPDPTSKPPTIATAFVVDLQSEHATLFPWFTNQANVGVDPNIFSLTTLRKKMR
ncbi:MAG: DUF1329 domain-containing protein [Deltaproteobacteria bacterium]|nr:DUF1329 domain-containing protein [Deltaproteobacteria bacterium]MCB9488577.1 DUF1329 domain-containing protein [Deltaproteobacteria bacterium]